MAILWALLLYLWAIFTQEPISPAVALMVEVWDGVGLAAFSGLPRVSGAALTLADGR